MRTHEKPLKIVQNESIWRLASLRQEYLKLGYNVNLDGLKGILEVFDKRAEQNENIEDRKTY